MKSGFRGFLLASAALVAFSSAAFAQTTDDANAKLEALQRAVADLNNQVQQLKKAQANADSSAALGNSASPYAKQPKVSLDNGRLQFASADGRFTAALRSLVQFDYGYFSQGKNPSSVDLNSGSNFRRAQIGLVGTAWSDWSYNFTYDFGGNGVEKNGYIYYAYIEYAGLAPFHARIGALTPFLGIEDSTGSGDLLFLERASAQDVSRNIAGGPGREGIDLFAQGDNYLVSVSYTGKKTTDAATFDAQQALVSRGSWLAINGAKLKWLLDAGATDVLSLADAAANTNTSNFTSFSNGPELAVDSTKTVNTGNIDAKKIDQYQFESAFEYGGLYAQGGWDHYHATRRTNLPNPSFSGWYAQASYALTGEAHPYDPVTASFRNLVPTNPLGAGGLGAWEVAARYSNIDLDYLPLTSTALGGVAGGKQNVWTLGLNWYPTNGLKFQFDYYNLQVNHVNAPASDISANAFGIRSQISF
jgi:phosphate-selective porin OprO and OprP